MQKKKTKTKNQEEDANVAAKNRWANEISRQQWGNIGTTRHMHIQCVRDKVMTNSHSTQYTNQWKTGRSGCTRMTSRVIANKMRGAQAGAHLNEKGRKNPKRICVVMFDAIWNTKAKWSLIKYESSLLRLFSRWITFNDNYTWNGRRRRWKRQRQRRRRCRQRHTTQRKQQQQQFYFQFSFILFSFVFWIYWFFFFFFYRLSFHRRQILCLN